MIIFKIYSVCIKMTHIPLKDVSTLAMCQYVIFSSHLVVRNRFVFSNVVDRNSPLLKVHSLSLLL